MSAVTELSCDVGRKSACKALNIPRATYYRHTGKQNVYPLDERNQSGIGASLKILFLRQSDSKMVAETEKSYDKKAS